MVKNCGKIRNSLPFPYSVFLKDSPQGHENKDLFKGVLIINTCMQDVQTDVLLIKTLIPPAQ